MTPTLSHPAALRAIEDAALAETFDPMALARSSEGVDPEILKQLADVSDEVPSSGGQAWRVRSDARQTLLAALADSGRLEAALARQADPDAPFSRYLAQALRGQPLEADPASVAERETAIVAYEVASASLAAARFGKEASRVAQQGLSRLRSLSSLEAERSRSRTILPGELIGRVEERAALVRFIESGIPDDDRALAASTSPKLTLRPFLITGCGGAGKSALLADIIRARREGEGSWAPIVLLDFDRPANCRGGPAEWYSELSRQLGLGRTALGQRMKQARAQARQAASPDGATDSPISGHLVAEAIRNSLTPALVAEEAAGLPLLVVLDTFEEVLTRSDLSHAEDGLFADVLRWAAELAGIRDYEATAQAAFSQVRVIVSGRSRPDLGDSLHDWFCGEMEIGALSPPDAAAFLRSRDKDGRLTAELVDRAVEVVGGHPLSLILFERFVRTQPDAVDEVLGQGDLSRMMSGEEAARTLYSRFLRRLNVEGRGGVAVDPEKVRRIAHPGLVLREVTAEHIEAIIAPGCGVPLGPGEAQILFDRLTDQVWLVEELRGRTPRTVRHRPDVRRLMLPMMNPPVGAPDLSPDQAALGHEVRAVRRRAVDWFEGRSSQALDEAQVEAAYHRAFLDDIDGLVHDAALWKLVWSLAPDDVPAMPPRAAALVRYHGRSAAALSREQTEALPEELRKVAAIRQTEISLAAGRYAEAAASAETVKSIPDPPPPPEPPSGHQPRRASPASMPPSLYALARDSALGAEVNAAFLGGQYFKAAAIGWRAIIGMAETPLFEPLPIDEDITSHWIWRAALARMMSPRELPRDEWLHQTFHRLTSPDRLKEFSLDSAGLVLAAAAYIASAGEAVPSKAGSPILAALVERAKALKGPGSARLLTCAAIWMGRGSRTHVFVPAELMPEAVSKVGGEGRLFFQARPNARRFDLGASRGGPVLLEEDGCYLLNARLPELEPLILAQVPPAIQQDSERFLRAVERLAPKLPYRPNELDPGYLRQRFGDSLGSPSALASVIAAANAHGLLPDLLSALHSGGPPVSELRDLDTLVATYSWLLGARGE